MDFSDWSFEQQDFWGGFKSAILQKRVVEFDYYSSYGEKTRRRTEPIQLWFKSRAWYLKAYDLTKQSVRLYRLSRVRDMDVTDETFAERNLLLEETERTPPTNQRPDVTLRLRIKPEMTYRVLDEVAAVVDEQDADGNYIVTVCWPEDNWVYGWILSFGEFIEVLEPEHVRKIIHDKARKIYGQHEQKQTQQLVQSNSELLDNMEKLHTTELGKQRIKKNLGLNKDDIVAWCKEKISNSNNIFKKGKNFYVDSGDCTVTINAHSFTIITAHKNK